MGMTYLAISYFFTLVCTHLDNIFGLNFDCDTLDQEVFDLVRDLERDRK